MSLLVLGLFESVNISPGLLVLDLARALKIASSCWALKDALKAQGSLEKGHSCPWCIVTPVRGWPLWL